MVRSLCAWVPMFLIACTGEKVEDTGAPPLDTRPQDSETADPCPGGTPPVIDSLTLENTGLKEYEAGEFYPTLTISAATTDEDWDLETYQFYVWFDETVDGAVAQDDNGLEVQGTVSDDGPCTASEATIGMQIFLLGGGVEYDTLYEWGGIVIDSNGVSSEMAITSGCTPTSEGEDGCA